MEINKIYNEDNIVTMKNHIDVNSIDVILTSPPYNTSRKQSLTEDSNSKRIKNLEIRYDCFDENMTNDEYIEWTLNIFRHFDKILKKDGCVLYNISYGSENVDCMFRTVNDIITKTNFKLADCIAWKKKSALPDNQSPNKATRICEFVYVIVRSGEFKTFKANKKVSSVRETGQKMYSPFYNFIEAPNNDGKNNLDKAAFSTKLVTSLLELYAPPKKETVVFDPFIGTGPTAVGAVALGMQYLGSEISAEQVKYSIERIKLIQRR